ncbi:PREDICTED: uncharacterized protein LOC108752128 isoform X3 [Trachymyrmex septentrionalis]|uniref:uncharacterized protein LOC108752128 isoform X3 n=1 Tax=Trachymyrmex septentrionalis TaxID=34720 RepID=UPI00084ED209|nr:PREDICTED: uncharacterized protein LOC108752128 isoform X3 [Trachymyrmex septentrionalis]XP_018348269.1 PREDICTED: uncharacterized protein LOC108752128 isoform X3 [Trachymyrmex septentrionalis]
MRAWLLWLFLLLVVLADRSFANPYFDDGEDVNDLQADDSSDYTDTLENLMRVAQKSSLPMQFPNAVHDYLSHDIRCSGSTVLTNRYA